MLKLLAFLQWHIHPTPHQLQVKTKQNSTSLEHHCIRMEIYQYWVNLSSRHHGAGIFSYNTLVTEAHIHNGYIHSRIWGRIPILDGLDRLFKASASYLLHLNLFPVLCWTMITSIYLWIYVTKNCWYLESLTIHAVAEWVDTWSQPSKVLDSVVVPAKDVRTGCPDAPSDGFVSHS